MPAEKLSMKKIKELLRLHYENGLSYRELSRSLEMVRILTKMNGDSIDRERFNSPGFAGTLI